MIKHFPLQNHRYARQAATAALAADRQGKFWQFHEKLFEHFRDLNDAKIDEIAAGLGLDKSRFSRDLSDPALQVLISRDMENGIDAGVRGTPTIFINGKLLGNRSLPGFQQMIDAELKKKK